VVVVEVGGEMDAQSHHMCGLSAAAGVFWSRQDQMACLGVHYFGIIACCLLRDGL
jgi:hypothetical protein